MYCLFYFSVCLFLVQKEVVSFQWDQDSPQDGAVLEVLLGSDATFPFSYSLDASEKAHYATWSFKSNAEGSQYVLIAYKKARFTQKKGYTKRLKHDDKGVVTLSQLTPQDSGLYRFEAYVVDETKAMNVHLKHYRLEILPVAVVEKKRAADNCSYGTFGPFCQFECSEGCQDTMCDSVTGNCIEGCRIGYDPNQPTCNKTCPQGLYGMNCQFECNVGCKLNECDSITGDCTYGCKPGYSGSVTAPKQCENSCPQGSYGLNCQNTCNDGCQLDVCDPISGQCTSGCKPGYIGSTEAPNSCENLCPQGTYGPGCEFICMKGCATEICNPVTGDCTSGCKPGYTGTPEDPNSCENWCLQGTFGAGCNSTCNEGCQSNECDHITGDCTSGCKPGYIGSVGEPNSCANFCPEGKHGPGCNFTCNEGCQSNECDAISGNCTSGCKPGYTGSIEDPNSCANFCYETTYGAGCNLTCNEGCKFSLCDPISGSCTLGCNPGYIGSLDAPNSCENWCPKGTYGAGCNSTCNERCQSDQCDPITGNCTLGCKPGYIGSVDAPNSCDNLCPQGKHGPGCQYFCTEGCKSDACDAVTGVCTLGCKPGYIGSFDTPNSCLHFCSQGRYGAGCNFTCNLGCRFFMCSPITGDCTLGCNPGYIGSVDAPKSCDNMCPQGTYGPGCNLTCNEGCKSDQCDAILGNCTLGCKPGYIGTIEDPNSCENFCPSGLYGPGCDSTCNEGCQSDVCDAVSGDCTLGCKPGYTGSFDEPNSCGDFCPQGTYGAGCNFTCNEGCESDWCDAISGECVLGCKPGYTGSLDEPNSCGNFCQEGTYGPDCQFSCSEGCESNWCEPISGNCVLGCKPGYTGSVEAPNLCENLCPQGSFGDNCENSCPEGCMSNTCDAFTGVCTLGCEPGYELSLSGEIQCRRSNCSEGTFGPYCQYECSEGCEDNMCDAVTGECTEGCRIGLDPKQPTCNKTCPQGSYGMNCESTCSEGCELDDCDAITGGCTHGCKPGYSESVEGPNLCENKCPNGTYGLNCQRACYIGCKSDVCHSQTGRCILGCKEGYILNADGSCKKDNVCFAGDCEVSCIGCLFQMCSTTTGHCLSRCRRGYYMDSNVHCQECPYGTFGMNCEEKCSSNNCRFNMCDAKNGSCTFGCYHGYILDSNGACVFNDKGCPVGYYGEFCYKKCSPGCVDGTCDYVTGQCTKGCRIGWSLGENGLCEDGYSLYGRLWLKAVMEPQNYFDASLHCLKHGGHLAYAKTSFELWHIYNGLMGPVMIPRAKILGRSFWLGGDDLNSENVFKWSDGTSVELDLFVYPEPDNNRRCPGGENQTMVYKGTSIYPNRGQNCLLLSGYFYGFNDECCLDKFPFVCQYDSW